MSADFPFPDKLEPGETYWFPEVDHNILSAGYAMLQLRLFWIGTGLRLEVRDETGQAGVQSDAIEQAYVHQAGKRAYMIPIEAAFSTFRSKGRGEVYQSILIGIALAAFFVNLVVGIYNALKRRILQVEPIGFIPAAAVYEALA